MRRFLIKLFVLGLCLGGALGLIFNRYVRQFPPERSFYAASLDKHSLLATQASPRLVLVGGSSLALGLDSGLVAGRCGLHPVNMGMNVAVGLEFMLDEVQGLLRPGDVVLLAPEYHAFQKYYRTEPEYAARLVECRPGLLKTLPWSQLRELLDRGYLHHLGRVARAMCGLEARLLDSATNVFNRREAFNENGDIVAHHGQQVARGRPLRFELRDSKTVRTAIARLNQFHELCQRRGCLVFFSHPPYERRWFERFETDIRRLDALLASQVTIPRLDTVDDMLFPSEDILDVEYHLNYAGKMKRSERVAASLARALRVEPP